MNPQSSRPLTSQEGKARSSNEETDEETSAVRRR